MFLRVKKTIGDVSICNIFSGLLLFVYVKVHLEEITEIMFHSGTMFHFEIKRKSI